MTHRHLFVTLSVLALLMAPAARATTYADIDTDEKNFAPTASGWEEYGDADVLGDGRIELSRDDSREAYVSTDVDVSDRYEGDYALFVSFTRAEAPYESSRGGAENIAGLPYLYGSFLNEDDRVEEAFQQSTMRHLAESGTAWNVTYGYQRVPEDVETIRLFLRQASRSGIEPDGRSAWFYDPGLFLVDSKAEAMEVVSAYRAALDAVADDLGGRASTTSDTRDTRRGDETSGALLKCPGHSDVYSLTASDTLKRFPDEETFYAWGHSFADVRTISCDRLDDYRVSGTWTYERADYLVKFRGQPAVFTLDNDLYLRLIPDEETARDLFGSRWTSRIREYPVSEMGEYRYGVPHASTR